MKKITLLLAISYQLLAISFSAQAQLTTLLNFNDTNGYRPYGSLLLSGNALYGMTEDGGIYQGGNVFSVDTNGGNATNRDSFNSGSTTGGSPYYTNLVILGNKMYGMTSSGGIYGNGNIFSIDTSGSGYKDLWDFDFGGDTNGAYPEGSLTLVGGKLFGMTEQGGMNSAGNIFRIDTNGSGYKDLVDFGNTANGLDPYGSLTLSGGKLFGMTVNGGVNSAGNIFNIDTNGSGYKDLWDFQYNGTTNGAYPYGDVTIAGGNMYGMTYNGGLYNYGNIFTIDTNGNNYVDLWDFQYNSGTNGTWPYGSVTVVGNKLYGMTYYGGVNVAGNLFSIDTNYAPASYTDLVDFNYNSTGGYPLGSLTLSANKLYGMTYVGGSTYGGTIFSIDTNGSNFNTMYNYGANQNDGVYPYGSLTLDGNKLYTMTSSGGQYNEGTILSIDTDGTNYIQRYVFGSGFSSSKQPFGDLVRLGNKLYGMSASGGSYQDGNIFSIDTNGSNYKNLWIFDNGGDTNGSYPQGNLTLIGGKLYGMTEDGGVNNDGNIFRIDTDGSGYKDLFDFNGINGESPESSLTLAGSKFYGMTNSGGINYDGNIFSIDTTGNNFKNLWSFDGGGDTNGSYPVYSNLTISGHLLYGMTEDGGVNGEGNIFKIDTNGSGYKNLWSFDGGGDTNGSYPFGSLALFGSRLYGMTENGGVNNYGNIFSIDTLGDSSSYKDLVDFNGINGRRPTGSLTISQGSLYGMTEQGGTNGDGVVFRETLIRLTSVTETGITTCHGDSTGQATATASGVGAPFFYTWSNGASQSNVTGLGAGTYTVTVTDSTNLPLTATVIITQPTAISVVRDSTGANGGSNGTAGVTASGGTLPYTYSWTPGGQTTASISGLAAGTYTCTIRDNHGCDDIVAIDVKNTTGIQSINNSSAISIYPNPSTGIVNMQLSGISGQSSVVEVYNMLGEKVYSQFTINNSQFTINLSTQPNGVYLYRVITENGNLIGSGRLVIQK